MPNVLTNLIHKQQAVHADRDAIFTRDAEDRWAPHTWSQLARTVDLAARALDILGIGPQDTIALFTANRTEGVVTDFAAYANRAIPVSIYSTSTAEQIRYIVNDSGAAILFAGTAAQLDLVRSVADECPTLRHIIVYDDIAGDDRMVMSWTQLLELGAQASTATCDRVDERSRQAQPDDIATLIYTSGTTGEPKGAILTHANFDAAIEIHRERLTMLSDSDTSLCFLPLSHIFEKAWTYFCLLNSIRVYINPDPKEISRAMREVKPTCMCSVPRLWEKAYHLITTKLSAMPPLKRAMVQRALSIGRRRNLQYARLGLKAPFITERLYRIADRLVFRTIRRTMGVDNGNIFPTAGAPLSPEICEFFHTIGVNIVIGYGLSETTATVTCFPDTGYEIGSVGNVMPRLHIRISDENSEILVKGPTVMSGYYNKPDDTKAAFTDDGYFRTGDAGYIDADGSLVLTERIKDLFKTSNGKYIAPQMLESRLGGDRFIEQVAVIGESRKYVTAIIVPAIEAIKEYARQHRIRYRNIEELVRNSEIIKLIEQRIEKLQQGLASFEKIKRFTLLPREFTMESGELTNTLKLRRSVINNHYAGIINAMYT